ncbi:hypothetical protein K388_07449 [Streptomyces sp. KhCrAH-43]|nr:hypothetical protein [Streptomyces sp. SID4920]MYX64167.1 hypothetical protein [Streptomyces sp. SID8373]RAJ43009.1 hypothetical protein K388_07449 [Streptomyces sp. KhCrAH-43]
MDWCFFGPWWGLGTGLAAYALRKGIVVEYRTGRRQPHGHPHRPAPAGARGDSGALPSPQLRRAAAL